MSDKVPEDFKQAISDLYYLTDDTVDPERDFEPAILKFVEMVKKYSHCASCDGHACDV